MAWERYFASIYQAILISLTEVWRKFFANLPNYFSMLIILLVGYAVGRIIEKLVYILLRKFLNLEGWLKRKKLTGAIYKIEISRLISLMAKWYVYILFLAQAILFINLPILTSFFSMLVEYLPRIFASIIVFILGLLLGEIIKQEIMKSNYAYRKELGSAAKYLIAYLVLVITLQNIGFDVSILIELLKIAFAGFVITLSLIIGIGVGFAYKKEIGNLVKDLVKKQKKKRK